MTNQEAIEIVKTFRQAMDSPITEYRDILLGALDMAIEALEIERPKGEWIDHMTDKGYVECPFCHKEITGGDLNFCVRCGANMRGNEK